MSPKRQSFPPDLSKVPSEFKILCDDHGGPVPLSDTVELRSFELACGQFPFGRSWNAYREWEPDKTEAMRHWPWVALAADQYRFEREAKAQYANEPKPSEVTTLINSIATDAKALRNNLMRLQELSYRLGDAQAPLRRPHISWLHEFISQIHLAGPRAEIDDDPIVMIGADSELAGLYLRLNRVELAATAAAKRIAPELLRRPRRQSDPGLPHLVDHAAVIWVSLTRRRASVNRVTRRGADKRPDFAIFVTNIAKMACGHEPTLDEIATAFRTRNSAKSKSL